MPAAVETLMLTVFVEREASSPEISRLSCPYALNVF